MHVWVLLTIGKRDKKFIYSLFFNVISSSLKATIPPLLPLPEGQGEVVLGDHPGDPLLGRFDLD